MSDITLSVNGTAVERFHARAIQGLPQGLTLLPLSFEVVGVEVGEGQVQAVFPLPSDEGFIKISLTLRVLHRDTGRPTNIEFQKLIAKRTTELDPSYLPAMIRQALCEVFAHEVDEVLFQHGTRLRDPHKGML